MTVEVRRAANRPHTQLSWLDSWHCFSFGPHYDPSNTHHGLLVVSNDDVIAPGGGFPAHSHRDMEIVTWVLDGELEHRDSLGTVGVISPGLAQRMSAGAGITHAEMNASTSRPVHLVQMWVLPDTEGIEPSYEQRDVRDLLAAGGLAPVASGQGHDGAITIHQRDAVLLAGRLQADERATLPDSTHAHVFVAVGTAALDETGDLLTGDLLTGDLLTGDLLTGDAARLTAAGPLGLTAGPEGAELLVWATA